MGGYVDYVNRCNVWYNEYGCDENGSGFGILDFFY